MDVEALLQPVSDDDPVGPDSFDLAGRQAVADMFEREEGEVQANEWPGVVRQVVDLAGQTRDMWVAVKLVEAGARAGSLATIDDGAQLLAGLVERFWDDVHPKLDDYGFEARANTCASLTKIRDFLGPLRRTTLFETRIGNFSGEDLERFATQGDGAEGYGMFRVALDQLAQRGELEPTAQGVIDRLDSIRDGVRRADGVLTANSGSETSTNFQPTYDALESLRRLLLPHAGMAAAPEAEAAGGPEVASDTGGAAPVAMSAGPRVAGRIESRDDVIKALDAIADYYRQREPASPVPVVLKRARQWVTMDFMAVLADLVPGSVDDAKNVLLSKQDQKDEEDSDY